MDLSNFRIPINYVLNKDMDVVLEQVSLIIFYSKSSVWMAKNGKYNKHIIHISRIMHFVINGK